MPRINEGGPAFPKPVLVQPRWGDRRTFRTQRNGMTRRDFSQRSRRWETWPHPARIAMAWQAHPPRLDAEWAVELADAMIAELDQFDARDEPPDSHIR